jgi:hypothetical protein
VRIAQERQKDSIPHFTTRQRLKIRLRPKDEKLFIYDTDLNEFFLAEWSHQGTVFTVVSGDVPAPPPTNTTTLTENIIAGENLDAFVPILDDGTLANSNDIIRRHRVIGITLEPIGFSSSGKYAYAGLVTNPLWNFPNSGNIFLNGTTISHIKPNVGFILNMGKILSPDTILLNILYSIRL